MGAVDHLAQVIKTEKELDVRNQAIRSLGSIKSERSAQMLVDLYTSSDDPASRKAVISSLGSQGNATALVAIARKETNRDLRIDLVRRLTDLASRDKAAMAVVTTAQQPVIQNGRVEVRQATGPGNTSETPSPSSTPTPPTSSNSAACRDSRARQPATSPRCCWTWCARARVPS